MEKTYNNSAKNLSPIKCNSSDFKNLFVKVYSS